MYDAAMLRFVILALVLCHAGAAIADEQVPPSEEVSTVSYSPALDASYFWDDGAVPFIYGSAIVALSFRIFVEPVAQPRLFSASEGGAEVRGDTIPSSVVAAYALAGAGITGAVPGPARLHHLKGYSEAVLTTIALTEMSKIYFGRRRPDYQPGDEDPDQRQSFFSGHASVTASSSLYFALYFHYHLRDRLRGYWARPAAALVYAVLAASAVGAPLSRVEDNRHNASDVITGSVVGSAMSAIFFAYQESKFQGERETFYKQKRSRIVVMPDLQNRGVTLSTRW